MAKNPKGKYGKYSNEFRQKAVELLKQSENIKELAKELGIDQRLDSSRFDWSDEAGDGDQI